MPLAHAIKSIGTRVLNDRNQAIAHRYERHAKLGRRLLTPRGYGQVFQRLERLMNDVRVILDNSSRNGTMQQVLHDFGILDVDQIEPPYYWQLRDRFHTERRRRRKSSRARR